MIEIIKTQEYFHWINELKSKIRAAQTKVALTIIQSYRISKRRFSEHHKKGDIVGIPYKIYCYE